MLKESKIVGLICAEQQWSDKSVFDGWWLNGHIIIIIIIISGVVLLEQGLDSTGFEFR
jgi:hypothetical protein